MKESAMANDSPDVIPMIAYEDGFAALKWLAQAFGFRERRRMSGADGRLAHAEMEAGNGVIMIASPTPDYDSPLNHRTHCDRAQRWSTVPWVIDGVLVYVADIDAHYAQAKGAGARILSELEDGPPARRYRVEDMEGHRWMFMARSKD
jgi:uncharacterized glyoxalase superfamily protein PhnB